MSEHGSKAATADGAHAGETRRDFIHIAAATVAAGGVAAVAWPFVQQLAPAGDTKAASSAEVDTSKVPEGSEIRVLIGGLPFFIRHRTAAEIASAKAGDTAQLRDPATDDSRLMKTMDGKLNPAILVTSGTCTHHRPQRLLWQWRQTVHGTQVIGRTGQIGRTVNQGAVQVEQQHRPGLHAGARQASR